MESDFPLISPVTLPFRDVADACPAVRRAMVQVEGFVVGEIPRIKFNQARGEFWRALAQWAERNADNVDGILAGRETRSVGMGTSA